MRDRICWVQKPHLNRVPAVVGARTAPMLNTEYQGPYLNAVFRANICGPACFKSAKHAAKMRQKKRIMRRLCGKNAKTCGKNAAKKANYAAVMRQKIVHMR